MWPEKIAKCLYDRFWHLYKNCPKNIRDLGKLIVAKGFKKWPKVQSGHTSAEKPTYVYLPTSTYPCLPTNQPMSTYLSQYNCRRPRSRYRSFFFLIWCVLCMQNKASDYTVFYVARLIETSVTRLGDFLHFGQPF